ncbi:MAG: methyltransferase domain-containing protein [Dehalococcoidia bacterium]
MQDSRLVPGGRRLHNRRQARLFNQVAHQFAEPVPNDVQDRLAQIVAAARVRPKDTVLDVGTGTGVLLPFILACQPSRVVACDLSREMLVRARAVFKGRVRFFQRDVVDLAPSIGLVDVVFCNACFGNFYDPQQTLRAVNTLCHHEGRLVISHPMGKDFVRHLKDEQPEIVTSELPERAHLEAMLDAAGFRLELFKDDPDIYLAVASKRAGL